MNTKQNKYIFGVFCAIAIMLVSQITIFAQIRLNEVEIDTPGEISEGCEYAEVRGTPGSTVPANTFFLSVDGDSGQGGNVNYVGSIGGVQFGSNGTITIITNADVCNGRSFPAATRIVESNSIIMGFGAETYILVTTGQPSQIFEGQDLDANSDGQFDAAFQIAPIDGFGFVVNPTFNFVYGGVPVIFNGLNGGLDLPDAVTRFSNNTNAFDANAFYYGELATPDNSITYQAPLSANFPSGGQLTPGGPNVPVLAAPSKAVVDFNGDGRTDYTITRNQNGVLNWWTALNGSSEASFAQFGLQNDVPVPEDFDGDGRDDLAVWRPGAPFTAAFYIFQSSNNTVRIDNFGQTGDNPGIVGDWDGDGKADPSVYRAGSQSIFYFRGSSNNPNRNITFLPWGINGDIPLRGDFDGDDRLDAVIFRPSNGIWYILQSSNLQVRYESWGLATDRFVPADYDGDNRTDLAVFRDGIWYVRQSSNNNPLYQTWGFASDVLAPGDYDGDGRTDFAVWRAGVFYVAPFSGGSPIYRTWGLSGDFPVANSYTR